MWLMNCFGRSRCHLICITQEIRYHRTGHTINQQVWKPETHTNSSCLFVVSNYKSMPDACPFCCSFNLAIGGTQLQEIRRLNMPTQAVPTLTCCDQPFTTASLMPAPYIPDIRLETGEETCMKLDSLQYLVFSVWLDSNESWTCGYGVVVFGRWTVSTETGVTWGALTFGMIRIY